MLRVERRESGDSATYYKQFSISIVTHPTLSECFAWNLWCGVGKPCPLRFQWVCNEQPCYAKRGTLMKGWLLALGTVMIIGCTEPPPPPIPIPKPTPRVSTYKPPAYATYRSVASSVELNVGLNFPEGGVECESVALYHKLQLELIGCAVSVGDTLAMISASTYDMDTRLPETAWILSISPAKQGVHGTALMCVNIYEKYSDAYEQNCDAIGRMSLADFFAHALELGNETEQEFERMNRAVP